jgi:hypothetical protein
MRKTLLALTLAVPAALYSGSGLVSAASLTPTGTAVSKSFAAGGLVHEARRVVIKRHGNKIVIHKHKFHHLALRPWRHRPHYGRIVAGVTLGTILAVMLANTIPPPPAPDLCWYWTSPAHTHGYWDYCN